MCLCGALCILLVHSSLLHGLKTDLEREIMIQTLRESLRALISMVWDPLKERVPSRRIGLQLTIVISGSDRSFRSGNLYPIIQTTFRECSLNIQRAGEPWHRYYDVFFSCWPCTGIEYSTGAGLTGFKYLNQCPYLGWEYSNVKFSVTALAGGI